MSTLFYVVHGDGVTEDEALARATTEPVDVDAPPDVETEVPEFNDVDRAVSQHAGLTTSNLASHWTPSQQYAPSWAENANVTPSFAQTNSQQAQSGTAASREMSGRFGHGSMAYAIGIEPTIRDAAVFGNDYFAADEPGVQPTAGNYMEAAPGFDRDSIGAVSGRAAIASHEANQSGGISMWAGAMMPGVQHG